MHVINKTNSTNISSTNYFHVFQWLSKKKLNITKALEETKGIIKNIASVVTFVCESYIRLTQFFGHMLKFVFVTATNTADFFLYN